MHGNGTNRHAKPFRIRASGASGLPCDAWRAGCGWAFTAAYTCEEASLVEDVRAPSECAPGVGRFGTRPSHMGRFCVQVCASLRMDLTLPPTP